MNYIQMPNLPQDYVKLVVVDGRISRKIEDFFIQKGIKVIKTLPHPNLYEAISGHPDVMIHHIGNGVIVYAPDTPMNLLTQLKEYGFELIEGKTPLGNKYPESIPYNVARVGEIAFHNLKYTDPVLKKYLSNSGVKLIHVNQGYSKCSIAIIGSKELITSDKGIANAAHSEGIDALLVPPQKNIYLKNLEYGFIGGCTGLVDKSVLVLTGDLNMLDSSKEIINFLLKQKVQLVSFNNESISDIGSIIPLMVR